MPPALSDDEGSDVGNDVIVPIVSKRERKTVNYVSGPDMGDGDGGDDDDDGFEQLIPEVKAVLSRDEDGDEGEDNDEGDDEGDDNDEEDLEEGEFIVEKILDHRLDGDDNILFKVKWEGYEKKSDQTWEPEDNLRENASNILDTYFIQIGGREQIFEETAKALKTKKRARKSAGATNASSKRSRKNGEHPLSTTPPPSTKTEEWVPPAGSWDDHIASVDACEDDATGKLIVYLNWNNGKKTRHGTEVVYRRCPQKMLQFYERHVRIVKHDLPEVDLTT